MPTPTDITEFSNEFFTEPTSIALVLVPDGGTVAINLQHYTFIGGPKEALTLCDRDVVQRIEQPQLYAQRHGSYGGHINAIGVLQDAHCMITRLYHQARSTPEQRAPLPEVQLRHKQEQESRTPQYRLYAPAVVRGRLLRPNVLAVSLTEETPLEITVIGAPIPAKQTVCLDVTATENGTELLRDHAVIRPDSDNQPYFQFYNELCRLIAASKGPDAKAFQRALDDVSTILTLGPPQHTQTAFLQGIQKRAGEAKDLRTLTPYLESVACGIFDPVAINAVAMSPLRERLTATPSRSQHNSPATREITTAQLDTLDTLLDIISVLDQPYLREAATAIEEYTGPLAPQLPPDALRVELQHRIMALTDQSSEHLKLLQTALNGIQLKNLRQYH
jgi:hypothetical protein